jgi:hypothetical protein
MEIISSFVLKTMFLTYFPFCQKSQKELVYKVTKNFKTHQMSLKSVVAIAAVASVAGASASVPNVQLEVYYEVSFCCFILTGINRFWHIIY